MCSLQYYQQTLPADTVVAKYQILYAETTIQSGSRMCVNGANLPLLHRSAETPVSLK